MAGRHAADRDSRGGERIPPARARARSRLALALAALAIAAGVAVYGTLEADRIELLVLALGAGSVALLAFGLAVPSPPALVGSFVGIADAVPLWTYLPAILLSIAGTSLAALVLERMTDVGFRQWTRRVILAVSAIYLVCGMMLLAGVS